MGKKVRATRLSKLAKDARARANNHRRAGNLINAVRLERKAREMENVSRQLKTEYEKEKTQK